MKTIKVIVSGFALAAVCLMFTQSASAQTKPKGKPWPAPAAEAAKKSPAKGADVVKQGKDLYMQHCKSCHGAKGQGDGPKAEKIDISCGDFTSAEFAKVPEGEVYWKTTEGRKPMPSYKSKLSDNERWAVTAYVKSLAK